MARYTGADCRRCRREKMKLFLKGSKCESPKCPIEIRPYPPGEHGRGRTKDSEYLLQKREKQKCARIYGVLEKQFRGYYEEANKKSGKTGENLLVILESRLDNVVYRAGFATSRDHARQAVRHGHVLVNGKKVDIPSYRVHGQRHRRDPAEEPRADAVRHRPRDRRRPPVPGLARGHLQPDARARARPPGPPGHRHPGAGAADRRALQQVARPPAGAPGAPAAAARPHAARTARPHHTARDSPPRAPLATSYGGRRGTSRKDTTCSSHSARPSPRSRSASNRSRFVLEPLEPGFGYTLGNSLRRTLLSPRSPALPSPASASTASCTSSPPCRASRRTSPTSS